jgi:hypothetical protein
VVNKLWYAALNCWFNIDLWAQVTVIPEDNNIIIYESVYFLEIEILN